MSAIRNLGKQIIEMRQPDKNMSYREIQKVLKCSRGTINYHCRNNALLDTGKKRYPLTMEQKQQIHEFCKTKSVTEAETHFGMSKSTIKKYKSGGFLKTIDEENLETV